MSSTVGDTIKSTWKGVSSTVGDTIKSMRIFDTNYAGHFAEQRKWDRKHTQMHKDNCYRKVEETEEGGRWRNNSSNLR